MSYEKTIVIPIETTMHEALRKIAFEHKTSISKLTREALVKIIKKYDKSVVL